MDGSDPASGDEQLEEAAEEGRGVEMRLGDCVKIVDAGQSCPQCCLQTTIILVAVIAAVAVVV